MEHNAGKTGAINWVTLLLVTVVAAGLARMADSATGITGVVFLGLGVLVTRGQLSADALGGAGARRATRVRRVEEGQGWGVSVCGIGGQLCLAAIAGTVREVSDTGIHRFVVCIAGRGGMVAVALAGWGEPTADGANDADHGLVRDFLPGPVFTGQILGEPGADGWPAVVASGGRLFVVGGGDLSAGGGGGRGGAGGVWAVGPLPGAGAYGAVGVDGDRDVGGSGLGDLPAAGEGPGGAADV